MEASTSTRIEREIKVLCYYCTDYIPINQILFPRCGHPLCQRCLDELASKATETTQSPSCGICRVPTTREQFHRIYPQVSQSREQESVAHIASGIERMDAKTPAQSFQKGAQKLKKLAATSRLESSEKERLLSAAERMDKFIPELANTIMEMEAERVGLASDLETVTKEKQRLEKSYRKAHEEAKRYKKCREEKTALQQRIVELEKSYEELQETSHKALERVQGAYSALESQKRALVQEKELLERKLAVAERKAKALAHAKAKMDKKRKRPKEDEGDDSLIVE